MNCKNSGSPEEKSVDMYTITTLAAANVKEILRSLLPVCRTELLMRANNFLDRTAKVAVYDRKNSGLPEEKSVNMYTIVCALINKFKLSASDRIARAAVFLQIKSNDSDKYTFVCASKIINEKRVVCLFIRQITTVKAIIRSVSSPAVKCLD
jgi:hypothetical protein